MGRGDGLLMSLVVGIVGSVLAGLLFGGPTINESVSLVSVIISLAGAIVLLAIVNLIQRGRLR
jgi:uncharacterized membrane protein YeaQ/YmgE (transglycosylase-associated protein family)